MIRECARGIKAIHLNDLDECREIIAELDVKVKKLREIDEGLKNISDSCYQEYVEIKCLLAVYEKQDWPMPEELGVPPLAFLNGLADCSGELRRGIQLALRAGDKKQAEYLFEKLNEIYDNLMLLKFSASLVGGLKRKQDVLRGQIEQARSEMLRSG